MTKRLALLTGSAVFLAVLDSQAQNPSTGSPPAFTAAQAQRGQASYAATCSPCHGVNLDDGQFAPPLRGASFQDKWLGKTAADLFDFTSRTMPTSAPNSLGAGTYADLLAYILSVNDIQPSAVAFPTEPTALQAMRMPWQPSPQAQLRANGAGGGVSPSVRLPAWPTPPSRLTRISPVTDELLAQGPQSDWLTWRGTHAALGFSPLKEITKDNAKQLQLVWSLTLPAGPNESTPLVHDGVMFVHSFGDHVQAFDAKSGEELWHYAHRLPEGVQPSVKRNIAIYADKVYLGTSDVHVVALDIHSGKVVWDTSIAESKEWRLTGGPLVVKGKVMQGIVGRGPGGAYLQALDAQTGQPAWRFYSIARPDEPGGNSWNDLPLEQRNGGSIWTAGSYDPELNLVLFGPAPTYDTGPLVKPSKKRGITNDALYSDTTVAINPDTGKVVWHYQHMQNDQWDYDWAFERQIFQLPIKGKSTKVVITGGKEALYDILEANTGRYLSSFDLGLQTIITAVDPKTGRKTTDPNFYPGDGKAKIICPHAGGAKSWIPGSYNPDTQLLYVPLVESCMDMVPAPPGERGFLSSGVRVSVRPRPDSDGRYGRIQAVNVATGKTVWTERQRAPQSSGTLATAGGVVFAGALDRSFTAYDDATGKQLWRTRLTDVPNSAPISFSVDGKQYVAVVVGHGGAQAVTFPGLIPEIALPAVRSSSVWVFAVP